MATSSVSLGTSNLRGTSRPTRVNSSRALRTARSSLRQNSLISNPATPTHAATEPHGFYPAVTAFTDAIAALPRDFRRHTSLLKEVDAKAWFLEENLQNFLEKGLLERQTLPTASIANTIAGSMTNLAESAIPFSATNSVNGMALDSMSQLSSHSADPAHLQRRQLYMALRHNLMQMMVTMDEKNHVINNANDDLSRHIRRLDGVWPHISDEISEEARLGSLKHWAYTETNPVVKKVVSTVTRRDAGSSLAMIADNDIAHRSESRREAMLAKKQRLNQHMEFDFDDKAGRKGAVGVKSRKPDTTAEPVAPGLGAATGKRKTGKGAGAVLMERTVSARTGGTAMSREPSQQDNAKKRKAPASGAGANARKRLNPGAYESPKLASSPLANVTGKDTVKRSPALSTVRPVARVRQNSTQSDVSRNRPSSSIARHINGATLSEVPSMMVATGRSASEVKTSMKESANSRGDKLFEEDRPINGESLRGGILLERTASKQSHAKKEANHDDRAAPSPRMGNSSIVHEARTSRGRVSKVSTPVVGTFEEAEADASRNGNGSENSATGSSTMAKAKRAPRPRMKDHHGLQDSLSPKGLPSKRTHNKTSSFSSLSAQPVTSKSWSSRGRDRNQDTDDNTGPGGLTTATSTALSRSNSRNNHNANITSQSTPSNSQPPGLRSNTRSSEEEENDNDNDNDIENENDNDGADVEGEGDAEADLDEDERYCFCNGPSYGEMVACDNKHCTREWFHLGCIGLKKLPSAAKWYCDECKEELTRKGKFVA